MAAETLEERVTILETRIEMLQRLVTEKQELSPTKEKRGWQAIVGTFADDPIYEEAMRLGREWRAAQVDHA